MVVTGLCYSTFVSALQQGGQCIKLPIKIGMVTVFFTVKGNFKIRMDIIDFGLRGFLGTMLKEIVGKPLDLE